MDEIERQRRTDFIRQVRSNNRIDALNNKLELIHRVARMKGEDKNMKWKADAEERELQREAARVYMKLSEQEQEQVVVVEQQIKQAIASAIVEERQFLVQLIGSALGQALDAERADAKDELAKEVRQLWSVLTEVQTTIAALNRASLATHGKAAIDLPNPLTRSH